MSDVTIPPDTLPPGAKVSRIFVDAATGYGVIEHDGGSAGSPVHIALVDLRTGAFVPIDRRAAEIPRHEVVRIDEARGWRLSSRHTIDMRTGFETLEEELTDMATGVALARGTSSALRSADYSGDLIASHLERMAAAAAEEAFWRDEYPRWSFDRRTAYWCQLIRRHMRWQGEWGLDEFAMFTPDDYGLWRTRDADIDRILDAAIDLVEPTARAEIDRRLGRAKPKGAARKKSSAPRRRSR